MLQEQSNIAIVCNREKRLIILKIYLPLLKAKKKITLNFKQDRVDKLLLFAIKNENLDIIDKLLNLANRKKITLNFKQDQGDKSLLFAIENENLDIIYKLLDLANSKKITLNFEQGQGDKVANDKPYNAPKSL